jgi:hypothetical protein
MENLPELVRCKAIPALYREGGGGKTRSFGKQTNRVSDGASSFDDKGGFDHKELSAS